MKPFYWFALHVTRLAFAVAFHVTFEGGDNIPASGGALVVSNHSSLRDPLLVAHGIPHREVFFMSKAEWFDNPIFAWLFSALGVFPVNRGQGDMSALTHAEELIHRGELVGIFPEGTRNLTGGPMKPKSGAAYLARQTGADIIPCAISFGKKRGFRGRITVRYGKVIPYASLGFEEEGNRTSLKKASKVMVERINELLGYGEEPCNGD